MESQQYVKYNRVESTQSQLSKSIGQEKNERHLEAIVFGFLAYFGSEVGEFTHKQYDEHIKCRIEVCEKQGEQEETVGTITIKIEHNEEVVSETRIGEGNE